MSFVQIQDPAGLAQGVSTFGSALGQALQGANTRKFETEQKDKEFQRKRDLEKAQRLRNAESGTILQNVISQVGANPSLTDLGNAYSAFIEQGGEPDIGKQFFTQAAPFLKEQARTQGAQSFFQQLFRGGGPGAPGQGAQPTGQIEGFEETIGPQGTQAAGFDFSSIPEDKLVAASAAPYPEIANLAKTELQRRDLAQKRFEGNRKYESEISTPFLKKVDESRDAVRQKESAVDLMKNAIEEGNLGFFSKDNLANFLGRFGEGLRTAKGAQLLNAQKEFLLGNIQRAGSRPNQWIEQQISQMLARVGRSDEANLTVTEALQAETDIQRNKIQVTDDLAERYRKELGYVPANIGALVDKELKPYADNIQNRLAYKLRELYEKEQGLDKIAKSTKKVPTGTPLTLGAAQEFVKKYKTVDKALENARKLGYSIPTKEEWQRYQR